MRRPARAESPENPPPSPPSRATPLAFFLVVAAAIAAVGTLAYLASASDLRAQEQHEIATIALLKVREVARWRDERLADASGVALDLAEELAEGGDPQRALDRLYEGLRGHREYSALAFVGPDGRSRFASGAPVHELSDPSMQAFILHVLEERRAALSPVHRHPGDPAPHLNAVAPAVSSAGRVLGAVVLRVDPRRQFFAMLQAWPRPSETAETMLVGLVGGAAVVMNDLRGGDEAMSIRVPLGRTDDPAALAASGAHGVVEARDHRGHPVIAAIAPVPDTPWTLVAEMDSREALAPLSSLRLWTGLLATALVLAVGAGALLWWRTEMEAFERVRVAGEAERRLLARRLENLGKWTSDAVFVADTDSRVVDANERATRLFGYAHDELVGMPVRDLRDPATVADFESRVREQVEHGASMFETRYRRKDGSTFPAEVSVHVDEYDGRRYFQAIIRDVTARERAAEALRASEAKFRAAFEFASLGILIVTADGRILETNRAFRKMLGFGDEEARGLTVADLHDPDDDLAQVILAQMVTGARDRVEMPRRYRRRDGTTAEAILRASALRDEAGAFRFALGVVEDLSEKARLEARLAFADRMASVGTLAAGVAHEINNPLAFILSNLDFALREVRAEESDPELHRALEDALDGAVRVREIVRDLRTFSRPADDRRTLLDPRRVLQSAIGLAANEIRHRAELVVDPGDVPLVFASEHRLGQVFLNLLINAAQAIPEGNTRANAVRAATSTAPDGRALIEVSDTGVGIAPETLPRIFDPFFTTKPVGVGTGLGLSICHGIVTQLGGEITVESAPGSGSTFRVYLPAGSAEAHPAPAVRVPVPVASVRRGRVLVVDDEALVGRAVMRMLAPPHEVVTRTSAHDALQILAEDRDFDVILCDLMMPGMTGMELHDSLAAEEPELAARMIFLTGGAFTEAARSFLDRVPNPRLEKPMEREALQAVVSRAVARAAA